MLGSCVPAVEFPGHIHFFLDIYFLTLEPVVKWTRLFIRLG